MDILLATLGSAGDVHPIVGLAIALKERGHKVKIIASPYFKSLIESVGVEFIALGSLEQYLSVLENPEMWNPKKGINVLAQDCVLPMIRPLYDIITSHDPNKTIVAATSLCLGARLAQEKHKFPLATIHLQPSVIRSIYRTPLLPLVKLPKRLPPIIVKLLYGAIDFFLLDKIFGPALNDFRKELGLSKINHILGHWMNSPEKVIGLFPEWLATPQRDWPKNTELTGFIHFDGAREKEQLTDEMASFLGEKEQTLVFTAGTAMKHAKDFFQASVQATLKLGKRALLLTKYASQLPDKLPTTIKHVEYIPFSIVLGKIGAFVHHGGIGTCGEALSAGVPQLIIPKGYDQPDNAARLENLGVASVIHPENYNAETASEKLSFLLNSARVSEQCQIIQKKVDFTKALNATCEALERLAR